jgi:uncharacterized phage protein (TIGR01671 family)
MREIKYRAWDKRFKIMFQVSEMSLGRNSWVKGIADQFSREFILMQYTGLKDKNGVEIYEGDILRSSNDGKNGCDVWNDLLCSVDISMPLNLALKDIQHKNLKWNFNDYNSVEHIRFCEIMGNIYENQELLGK